jgi:hypothetical protein
MQVPGSRTPVAKFAYLACLPSGAVVTAHVSSRREVRSGSGSRDQMELNSMLLFLLNSHHETVLIIYNYCPFITCVIELSNETLS